MEGWKLVYIFFNMSILLHEAIHDNCLDRFPFCLEGHRAQLHNNKTE